MIFKVIIRSWSEATVLSIVREVEVPSWRNTPDALDAIFHYGQNDFQPKKCPSVSVGDFILFFDDVYEVKDFGFTKLERVA